MLSRRDKLDFAMLPVHQPSNRGACLAEGMMYYEHTARIVRDASWLKFISPKLLQYHIHQAGSHAGHPDPDNGVRRASSWKAIARENSAQYFRFWPVYFWVVAAIESDDVVHATNVVNELIDIIEERRFESPCRSQQAGTEPCSVRGPHEHNRGTNPARLASTITSKEIGHFELLFWAPLWFLALLLLLLIVNIPPVFVLPLAVCIMCFEIVSAWKASKHNRGTIMACYKVIQREIDSKGGLVKAFIAAMDSKRRAPKSYPAHFTVVPVEGKPHSMRMRAATHRACPHSDRVYCQMAPVLDEDFKYWRHYRLLTHCSKTHSKHLCLRNRRFEAQAKAKPLLEEMCARMVQQQQVLAWRHEKGVLEAQAAAFEAKAAMLNAWASMNRVKVSKLSSLLGEDGKLCAIVREDSGFACSPPITPPPSPVKGEAPYKLCSSPLRLSPVVKFKLPVSRA